MLTLNIAFTPSLALYIWQSFRKGLWQAVQQYADVKDLWIIATEICSTQGCIAASMANNSAFLLALLALDPLQTFPVSRLLVGLYTSEALDPFILPQVEPVIQSLLLFAQLLAAVAKDSNNFLMASIVSVAPTNSTEAQIELRSAIISKLQQLTDISGCTPVVLRDPTTGAHSGALQAPPAPSKRLILLRSAALISKLATLTFSVKADIVGHLDAQMPMSVRSLWHTMLTLACDLNSLMSPHVTCTGTVPGSADQEEQTLCMHLCEHLVVTLRQAVKEPQAGLQSLACLRLLWAVLYGMHPELLRDAVKKLGKRSHALLLCTCLLCFEAALLHSIAMGDVKGCCRCWSLTWVKERRKRQLPWRSSSSSVIRAQTLAPSMQTCLRGYRGCAACLASSPPCKQARDQQSIQVWPLVFASCCEQCVKPVSLCADAMHIQAFPSDVFGCCTLSDCRQSSLLDTDMNHRQQLL